MDLHGYSSEQILPDTQESVVLTIITPMIPAITGKYLSIAKREN
jgi:hypothetical protein